MNPEVVACLTGVEVGCYAGGRGDETPRVVLLGGREDGRRCHLAQEPDGSWTLAYTAGGR
jgi:hypothetical protein